MHNYCSTCGDKTVEGKCDNFWCQLENRSGRKHDIQCACCRQMQDISDLNLIQEMHYVKPHGCSEGDYWTYSDLIFICPNTGLRNRLLFENYAVEWKKRDMFEHSIEKQFKRYYQKDFRSVDYVRTKSFSLFNANASRFVNNEFIKNNYQLYGLKIN